MKFLCSGHWIHLNTPCILHEVLRVTWGLFLSFVIPWRNWSIISNLEWSLGWISSACSHREGIKIHAKTLQHNVVAPRTRERYESLVTRQSAIVCYLKSSRSIIVRTRKHISQEYQRAYIYLWFLSSHGSKMRWNTRYLFQPAVVLHWDCLRTNISSCYQVTSPLAPLTFLFALHSADNFGDDRT